MSEQVTGTQAIDRAALLIATVVRADEPLSFVELHDECGLPKSTTSRLLTALERTELLERNAAGSYVAGPLFWLYATRHDPWDELVRLARPTLERIGTETREWTEVDVPVHASALGKAMLAFGALSIPSGRLEPVTAHTITDRDVLGRQLANITRRGYASTVDELEIGLTGVGVPVRGSDGEVIAALGVSGPSPRLEDRLDEIGRLLSDRAEQLSGLLRRRTRKEGVA
jgi:DNA-binding IclR family transcriptional regulator